MRKAQLQRIREERSRPQPMRSQSGPFATFGSQLLAIVHAGNPANMGGIDRRLLEVRAPIGAGEQIQGDGGFLVAPEFAEVIASKVYLQGELISRMTHFTTTKDWFSNGLKLPAFDEQSRADGSRFGGVSSNWANEASSSATNPKYRAMELPLQKLISLGYTTEELFTDAAVLEQALTRAYVNEFIYRFEKASLFGTGVGQPLGVINAPALIQVAKESGQAAATVLPQNILNMYARAWGPSRSRSCWVINQNIEPALIPLAYSIGTAGATLRLYCPSESDDEPFARMLGRPVLPLEYSPTLGQLGDIILIDPGEYLFFEKRGGMQSAVSMHINFLTDEMAFRWVWRVNGQPLWHKAVTPANGTSLSPYVALAAR